MKQLSRLIMGAGLTNFQIELGFCLSARDSTNSADMHMPHLAMQSNALFFRKNMWGDRHSNEFLLRMRNPVIN